jgi:plastocyanin
MRFKQAPLIVVLALAMVALLASATAVGAAPGAQQTVNVSAVDFAFQPATITITAGDTIVWTNTGAVAHTVTASDGSFDSGLFGPGQTYSRTFTTAGTIPYYCIPHGTPQGGGMAGTIVVHAAQVTPPAAPAATPVAPAAPAATPMAPAAPAATPVMPAAPAPTPATLPTTGEGPASSGLTVAMVLFGLAVAGLGVGLARRGARG